MTQAPRWRVAVAVAAALAGSACSGGGGTAQGSGSTTLSPTTAVPTTVATAGGWRMAITRPAAGGTISSVVVVCYEVTGPSREAAVAIDLTILGPIGIGPFRADAAVGRGTAGVPIGRVPAGRFDLRIQLIIDGTGLEGAVVTIPGVSVVAGATPVTPC